VRARRRGKLRGRAVGKGGLVVSACHWREHLLGFPRLGRCLIHGDLHTGNVLFRERGRHRGPVLIDWGRSRIGSPLEDVSSWLQSLGYWEPVARRKHDTLLARYLVFRGVERGLSEELRTAYWLAGASNALAGALEHHVRRALGTTDTGERQRSLAAAQDWLRIVRRADARWTRPLLGAAQPFPTITVVQGRAPERR
jgi:Ser/Thr protein kinase RdoA (MazF antagonist)